MIYDNWFFEENAKRTLNCAQTILPQVLHDTEATSVIDVGCGAATWALVAQEHGCDVHGVDGFVTDANLAIDPSKFENADLTNGFSCANYDLAICLEIGEHLPEESARPLAAGLCEAQFVLFSGAHPGQGGTNHINEQWSSYWAALFAEHGYVGSCDIRDRYWDDDSIEWFYRENIILFAKPEDLARIGYSQSIRDELHPRRP